MRKPTSDFAGLLSLISEQKKRWLRPISFERKISVGPGHVVRGTVSEIRAMWSGNLLVHPFLVCLSLVLSGIANGASGGLSVFSGYLNQASTFHIQSKLY